jgi:hypothetical protein
VAVEHILGRPAAVDTVDDLVRAYPWLEREDVLACLANARRVVGHERIEPSVVRSHADVGRGNRQGGADPLVQERVASHGLIPDGSGKPALRLNPNFVGFIRNA